MIFAYWRYVYLLDGAHFFFFYNVERRHECANHGKQYGEYAGHHEQLVIHMRVIPVGVSDINERLIVEARHLYPFCADILIIIPDNIL